MPSIYTHTIFALKVKNKLDKKTKKLIQPKEKYYTMFSQSFDNLYYYNFLSLRKGNDIRNLGSYAHTHKVQKYFINMIKYIKDNKLQKNVEILCYLYGAINHYVADSTLHPYITYRTGKYSKTRHDATKKYIGIHTNTEIRLDAYYYEKEYNKPFKKYKIYNDLCKKLLFSQKLKDTINYTFKETFDFDNMGEIFNTSYIQSKNVYKLLMYDPLGIKLFCYKLIDYITPNKDKKIASFSLHKESMSESFFNNKHSYWCYPADMDIISEESWDELFEKACEKAADLIINVNLLLNNKIPEEKFFELLGNNSYSTGLDCKEKKINQYFEY